MSTHRKAVMRVNHNDHITGPLGLLLLDYEAGVEKNDEFRARNMRKAVEFFSRLPVRIDNHAQFDAMVRTMPREHQNRGGLGTETARKVRELLLYGTIDKLEARQRDASHRAIAELKTVWGVGPVTAYKLTQLGVMSVAQLKSAVFGDPARGVLPRKLLDPLKDRANVQLIDNDVRRCLEVYEDLQQRIPRGEVEEIVAYVTSAAKRVYGARGQEVLVYCCGSFRRGKAASGDVDILISPLSNTGTCLPLELLLAELSRSGFWLHQLARGKSWGTDRHNYPQKARAQGSSSSSSSSGRGKGSRGRSGSAPASRGPGTSRARDTSSDEEGGLGDDAQDIGSSARAARVPLDEVLGLLNRGGNGAWGAYGPGSVRGPGAASAPPYVASGAAAASAPAFAGPSGNSAGYARHTLPLSSTAPVPFRGRGRGGWSRASSSKQPSSSGGRGGKRRRRDSSSDSDSSSEHGGGAGGGGDLAAYKWDVIMTMAREKKAAGVRKALSQRVLSQQSPGVEPAVEYVSRFTAAHFRPVHGYRHESVMGLARLPGPASSSSSVSSAARLVRRVDIKSYAREDLATAVLYFTGSDFFNRSMRLFAKKHGWSLSDRGLRFRISDGTGGAVPGDKVEEGPAVVTDTEEDVFRALGIPYRAPHERDVSVQEATSAHAPRPAPGGASAAMAAAGGNADDYGGDEEEREAGEDLEMGLLDLMDEAGDVL